MGPRGRPKARTSTHFHLCKWGSEEQVVRSRGEGDTARRLERERLDLDCEKEREAAVATAAQRYLEDLKAEASTAKAARWQEAVTFRAYAEAMHQPPATDADRKWVAHLFAMADRLDPLHRLPPAPELPESLTEYDLRDYLRGPHYPQ